MNVSELNEKNREITKKTDRYINLRFFPCKSIADDVDLPSEKTGTGRTLELDLECTIVPVRIGSRVGDIGNFKGRNYKAIRLVIS